MSQWDNSHRFLLLPELKIISHWNPSKYRNYYRVDKESSFEVCPKCATKSTSVHDRRWVKICDQPIRGAGMYLRIRKRRFRCPNCKSVFTRIGGFKMRQKHPIAEQYKFSPKLLAA
jgi:transposase